MSHVIASSSDEDDGRTKDQEQDKKHNAEVKEPKNVVPKTCGTLNAIYYLVKVNLGAGIFSFPSFYTRSGFFGTILILIFTTILVYITSIIMTVLGQRHGLNSYEETVKHYMGRSGLFITSSAAIIFLFGVICIYSVLIADTFPPLIVGAFGLTEKCIRDGTCDVSYAAKFFMDRKVVSVIISTLIMFPLSTFRNATYLSYVAIAGLVFVALTLIITITKSYQDDVPKGTYTTSESLSFFKNSGIVSLIATSAYANAVHLQLFPIFVQLKDPSLKNKKVIVSWALVMSVLIILIFSIPVYLSLNNRIKGNVLDLFPVNDTLSNIARVLFSLQITLSTPVVIFVCRSFLLNIFYDANENSPKLISLFSTIFIIVGSLLVSCSFCKFGIVISFTGGITASIIAFVLPQICWVKEQLRNGRSFKEPLVAFGAISTLFGAFIMTQTILDTIDEISNYDSSKCPFSFI